MERCLKVASSIKSLPATVQETGHFYRWQQEKLRRLSRMGYQDMTKVAVINSSGLSLCQAGVGNPQERHNMLAKHRRAVRRAATAREFNRDNSPFLGKSFAGFSEDAHTPFHPARELLRSVRHCSFESRPRCSIGRTRCFW